MDYYKIALALLTICSISGIAFIIMSPELFASLSKYQIGDKLDPQELQYGQRAVEECNLNIDEYNHIKKILFETDKALHLEKDGVKAESLFKQIRKDLQDCVYKTKDFTPYVEGMIGKIHLVFTALTGFVSLVITIIGFVLKRRDHNL